MTTRSVKEQFRKNLNDLLCKEDIANKDLAKSIGVSPSAVGTWLSGKVYPRTKQIESIARYFNCTVFELLGEQENDEDRLISMFRKLSRTGKDEALKRMHELTILYWYENNNKEAL